MSFYVAGSGTKTAILNTEHTVFYTTTAGVYVYAVNCSTMQLGDILELRTRGRLTSGGADGVMYESLYVHTQTTPLQYSIPVVVPISLSATIKQTAGTGRSYEWTVVSL